MLTVLHYVADAFWIVAMALIASTSRGALRRVPAEAKMPMQWGKGGKPTWRVARNPALGVMFGLPLVLGLGLSALQRLGVETSKFSSGTSTLTEGVSSVTRTVHRIDAYLREGNKK